MARKVLPTVGWREWVALPDLGVAAVKAKIDTGARTSALHAFGLEVVERGGVETATFEVHPVQRSRTEACWVEWPVADHIDVRSSNGVVQTRPVIRIDVEWAELRWPIDVTLTDRDAMGFRMLLGRAAMRRRVIVDPGRSFLGGRPR